MSRKQLRYDKFAPATEKASRIKKKIRAQDTRAELQLRKALWAKGIRYRVNLRTLSGRPDIAITTARLAIFVDGDFWHGRNWSERKRKLRKGSNSAYWIAKIESNMDRDRRKDAELVSLGWNVLRFWESDILRDAGSIADQISARLDVESRSKDAK